MLKLRLTILKEIWWFLQDPQGIRTAVELFRILSNSLLNHDLSLVSTVESSSNETEVRQIKSRCKFKVKS